ncbi:hypothetical protein FB45DRAFT_744784 [Roridomyces roridus]|uniref:Essential protein Yae1 N-terminal domain-containing protein n=1 Tax=Roridomyces roridus TaxID=1738132 RepID=A0AAD7BVY1_9AGAR|nr:hypothetical protein FB45DRAFT_744784 [Roridomyces roridus]
MSQDFDLETLVHLEQTLYDSGYQEGFAHGRIHGLIEGRALGREKGFELWEELAFYETFALTWKTIYTSLGREEDKTRKAHHIRHLLDLISQFPQVNPSASDSELDILKLSRQIQSRYRALCSTLGLKPSNIRASEADTLDAAQTNVEPVWKIENDQTMF